MKEWQLQGDNSCLVGAAVPHKSLSRGNELDPPFAFPYFFCWCFAAQTCKAGDSNQAWGMGHGATGVQLGVGGLCLKYGGDP